MPLAQGDKWRHTKVSALISILKGSPANAAELISRPRAHNCAFPGGAECEIVSLRSLASLRLLSFFLPRREFVFRCFLPSSRRAAAFLHLGAFRAFTAGCEYTACAAVFAFVYFFLLMFFSTFCVLLSHSPSLSEDPSITVETCREAVTELHNSLRRTVKLYTQVSRSVCGCVRERRATGGKI